MKDSFIAKHAYNRWEKDTPEYVSMPGYEPVDYSKGWVPSVHDAMLSDRVEHVFHPHDRFRTGNLHGKPLFKAYTDLCLHMGLAPPHNENDVLLAMEGCDYNKDGKISQF